MRAPYFVLLLTIAAAPLVGYARIQDEPHCAFADDAFMTFLAVSAAVTEYYVAHHSWPTTKQQLRAQLLHAAVGVSEKPSPRDVDQFLSRFSRIDLQPRGRDLLLAGDYHSEGKPCSQRIVLHPGRSTDEMLQASTQAK